MLGGQLVLKAAFSSCPSRATMAVHAHGREPSSSVASRRAGSTPPLLKASRLRRIVVLSSSRQACSSGEAVGERERPRQEVSLSRMRCVCLQFSLDELYDGTLQPGALQQRDELVDGDRHLCLRLRLGRVFERGTRQRRRCRSAAPCGSFDGTATSPSCQSGPRTRRRPSRGSR